MQFSIGKQFSFNNGKGRKFHSFRQGCIERKVWNLLPPYTHMHVGACFVVESLHICRDIMQLETMTSNHRCYFKPTLVYPPKRCVIRKDFDSGVFYSLTTWNFVNWQLGIGEGIHLSHICLVEAKLSEEILSHGAPFVFCGDL